MLALTVTLTEVEEQKPLPEGRVRLTDRLLRLWLFQSRRESPRTRTRSFASLVAEWSANFSKRFFDHSILSVAASSAFFMVLAIFPGLAAMVALYSFLGDPADISTFIATMPDIIPKDIIQLVQGYLQRLISRPRVNLGTFLISFFIAMWSANSAMKSLVELLNIVYERRETRSFLRRNVIATLMTLAFIAFMIVAINIMILPAWNLLVSAFGPEVLRMRWVALLFAVQVLISALYYFGPCGHQKQWHFLTPGATLAALSWVGMSMLFSLYLTNFVNYSITYGSLGVAAIFMTWLWLTVTVLLTGAEIDAAISDLSRDREVAPARSVSP